MFALLYIKLYYYSICNILFVEILAEMPDRVSLSKQISRKKLQNLPSNPIRIEDLPEIPSKFRQTFNGTRFLLYDSYEDDNGCSDDSSSSESSDEVHFLESK